MNTSLHASDASGLECLVSEITQQLDHEQHPPVTFHEILVVKIGILVMGFLHSPHNWVGFHPQQIPSTIHVFFR